MPSDEIIETMARAYDAIRAALAERKAGVMTRVPLHVIAMAAILIGVLAWYAAHALAGVWWP
jgi:hypothetical protein